jgi:hypothetical protein
MGRYSSHNNLWLGGTRTHCTVRKLNHNHECRQVSYLPDSEHVSDPLETAFRHTLSYLDELDGARVGATTTLDDLRKRFDIPLTAEGIDAAAVIDDLVAATRGGLPASSGGRFFAWVIGDTLPAAIAADWLTSV